METAGQGATRGGRRRPCGWGRRRFCWAATGSRRAGRCCMAMSWRQRWAAVMRRGRRRARKVSHLCACIGSLCLRRRVHGVPLGGAEDADERLARARGRVVVRPHCEPGDALLFDARLLHWGLPNASKVSHFCACIGSPCLRLCVHGASIGGAEAAALRQLPPAVVRRLPAGGAGDRAPPQPRVELTPRDEWQRRGIPARSDRGLINTIDPHLAELRRVVV
jgi:hypothetical protein